MKIVFDGRARLQESEEYQLRLRTLRSSLYRKYGARIPKAGPFRRWLVVLEMEFDYHRECKRIVPSERSLFWGCRKRVQARSVSIKTSDETSSYDK